MTSLRRARAFGGAAPEAVRVAVVGGGASGVITALHLLRAATPEQPVEVCLVDREARLGPGLAYRHDHPRHTLNNYAGRLSAVAEDPDHLVRWCRAAGYDVDPTDFLPRTLYGDYLTDLVENAPVPTGSALGRVRGTVRDVLREDDGVHVHLTGGWSVVADAVVLALGNPPPARLMKYAAHAGYLPDPWVPDLAEQVGEPAEVLLVGSGLTALDVVSVLHDSTPMTRFTLVSRHGLLPRTHRTDPSPMRQTVDVPAGRLEEMVTQVRALVDQAATDGEDWRDVVDTLRASANRLWRGLDEEEQATFVRDHGRAWEVARHRMPPAQAEFVRQLKASGRLVVRTPGEVDPVAFDRVVNCSGPAPVTTRGWNPLVDALLDRGTIRPHRLGLGLDLDPTGRVVDSTGEPLPDVFAVGPARRGLDWEVTAVPDLRVQALEVAEEILPALEGRGGHSVTA
ncbi:hypothetical protein G7072_19255 [Nocardioides sp. HDW12B]|uniref:FAD/NAD(P)-binding protein n=1 Tax=Nocardioides sp. HDW12B TaxID=2714939 RepID=UPI00140D8E12|nr:FAD/NAD(P)-binding protein [Nocardioides sp. HDW12B]QIK68188.1 hypothetical protein G7072_19255 [Nocardioides sp. HDW12B]